MTRAMNRRLLLQQGGAVALTLFTAGKSAATAGKDEKKAGPMDRSYTPPGKGVTTGRGIGDFDFLAGEWKIRHMRLKSGTDEWQPFESGATIHRVLDGMGSIEELRNPDGSNMGMGIRVWRPEQKAWADHWTGAGNGVVNPPQLGRFIDGEGVFTSEETIDGKRHLYRGIWDRITPTSCRWHQSSSTDEGATWQWNWWMAWSRVSA
jgi:hypothetical protein